MNFFRIRFCIAAIALAGAPVRAGEAHPPATNLWTFSFDFTLHDNASDCTPAVAPDGTIYAGSFDGKLHALAPDGKERWRFQAGREIKSSPAIGDDGAIYFGCRDNRLYAVTPAGKLKWTFATGAWVDSSPGIATDGTIYFGSWDKNFYAVKPDGSMKWKFAVGGIVDSSPAIATDGLIYFGSHNKQFYALNPDGSQRWTFPTEAEITSSPAIGEDGSVFFASTDGNLYHLKSDGTEIWRCRIGGGSASSPVVADNGNIAIAAGFQELIISPAGTVIWKGNSDLWMDETPAAAQGTVYFPAPGPWLRACRTDGVELWAAQFIDCMSSSPVISDQGQIYFCCNRSVVALQPLTAPRPAKSPWPMFRADARHTGRAGTN